MNATSSHLPKLFISLLVLLVSTSLFAVEEVTQTQLEEMLTECRKAERAMFERIKVAKIKYCLADGGTERRCNKYWSDVGPQAYILNPRPDICLKAFAAERASRDPRKLLIRNRKRFGSRDD